MRHVSSKSHGSKAHKLGRWGFHDAADAQKLPHLQKTNKNNISWKTYKNISIPEFIRIGLFFCE